MGKVKFSEAETSVVEDIYLIGSEARLAMSQATESLVDSDGMMIKRVPLRLRQQAQRKAFDALDALSLFLRKNGAAISMAQHNHDYHKKG